MVLAYHVIFSTYGFWLPNDPRGSWSDFVRAWELRRFGKATKVNTTRSVAHQAHDHDLRRKAKLAMKYPEVTFNGQQALAVAIGFMKAIDRSNYIIHACAILEQHIHLVVARHPRPIEQIIAHLKGDATKQLISENLHPLQCYSTNRKTTPTPWSARKGWVHYLDSVPAIKRSINYVEQNPLREGKPRQYWSFVIPYLA